MSVQSIMKDVGNALPVAGGFGVAAGFIAIAGKMCHIAELCINPWKAFGFMTLKALSVKVIDPRIANQLNAAVRHKAWNAILNHVIPLVQTIALAFLFRMPVVTGICLNLVAIPAYLLLFYSWNNDPILF